MDLLNSEFHFDRLDPWQPAGQQDAIQHSQAAEQEAVAAGHLLALLAHIAAGGQNLQAATMYRKPEAAAFRSQQEAEGTIWGHPPPPRFHPVAVKFGNAAGQSTGVTALGLSGRDPRLAHLLMAPAGQITQWVSIFNAEGTCNACLLSKHVLISCASICKAMAAGTQAADQSQYLRDEFC